MIELFLKFLNISISAGWLVLAVVLLRQCFRKAPKWISCVLWGIVALRLVLPFHFESGLSLIPSAEVIPQNIATARTPAIYSGIPVVNSAVNPLTTRCIAPESHGLETVLGYGSVIWLVGVTALLVWGAVSCLRLRRKVRASLRLRDNLYVCDDIDTPFILGILFPRIYIPSGMEEPQLRHVLAHENAHLKRHDHFWKPLGFLLLALHWFNPLLWLAYILLCRDIEQACDEKVIAPMDNAEKRAYSETLIACSVHRRLILACPVAFGEIGVKTRIKGILCYRKPSFWILLAAGAACAATAVCFLTDPVPCAHDYSSCVTVSATCTQRGVETFTCRLCSHSYTARTDLLAHTYAPGDVLAAPDCTHEGTGELICTGCGDIQTEAIAKTDHILGEPFCSKLPNCAETGEMSAVCTHCHSVQVVAGISTNQDHNLHEFVVTEATCETAGEGVILCSRCDYEAQCTYEPHGHEYTVFVVIKGSCKYYGIRELVCTLCGGKQYETLPKSSEHMWRPISDTGNYYCAVCGDMKSESTGEDGIRLFGTPDRETPWIALAPN